MLRIIKVTGNSLAPSFKEGDYVVITTIPFFLVRIKPGDVIVFKHPSYGKMIKKVAAISEGGGEFTVIGSHRDSVDSRYFGSIPFRTIEGKVIWHISKTDR